MIGSLLALALAAVPSPSSAVALPSQPGHPTVILAPRPGARAALVVRFQVGSVDDETEDGPTPGLTHLTQLALLRANARLDHTRLVEDLFGSDGELVVVTGLEWCEFRLEAASTEFDRLAGQLLTGLLAPALQGGETFEEAREKALHDRRESRGGEFLAELAHLAVPDAAYGSPPHGDRASLEAITPEQVRRHAARRFTPASATLSFAGAFDVRAARGAAARYAGGARARRRPPTVHTPFSMQSPASREVYMVAFRRELAGGPAPAVWVLAALLEERIHQQLRARGLGYAEAVEVLEEPWLSGLIVVVPARAAGQQPVGPVVEQIVAQMRSGELQEGELERNRAWVRAELERIDREPLALATLLARRSGATSAPGLAAAVEGVDRAALVAAAAEVLRDESAIRIFLNPQATRSGPLPDSFRAAGGKP